MKMMSIKGEINVITILMSVITGLGSFGTWTLYEAYNYAKQEISQMKEYRQATSIRLEKLEMTNEARWVWIEKTMAEMNGKFDKITEVKVRQ